MRSSTSPHLKYSFRSFTKPTTGIFCSRKVPSSCFVIAVICASDMVFAAPAGRSSMVIAIRRSGGASGGVASVLNANKKTASTHKNVSTGLMKALRIPRRRHNSTEAQPYTASPRPHHDQLRRAFLSATTTNSLSRFRLPPIELQRAHNSLTFLHENQLVRLDVLQRVHQPAGPANLQEIDLLGLSNTEMDSQIVLRDVAPSAAHFVNLRMWF